MALLIPMLSNALFVDLLALYVLPQKKIYRGLKILETNDIDVDADADADAKAAGAVQQHERTPLLGDGGDAGAGAGAGGAAGGRRTRHGGGSMREETAAD